MAWEVAHRLPAGFLRPAVGGVLPVLGPTVGEQVDEAEGVGELLGAPAVGVPAAVHGCRRRARRRYRRCQARERRSAVKRQLRGRTVLRRNSWNSALPRRDEAREVPFGR